MSRLSRHIGIVLLTLSLLWGGVGGGCFLFAQNNNSNLSDDGFTVKDNTFNPNAASDSLKASHKKIPKGIYEWVIDERFGDRTIVPRDTVQHLFMNSVFNTGKYGEYNSTGNLGAPRIERIATDRTLDVRDPFLAPYTFFITKPSDLRFTNTLSPITNLYYTMCGSSNTGEDHLKVSFATNVNKKIGLGFRFNYIYAYGYYQNQHNALFDYTMWASYLGERYNAHFSMSFDHMKVTENGGIASDDYVLHPEAFKDSYATNEMPVILTDNWNNQDAFHLNFAHRYNIGFYRNVPMTEMEKEAKRFALKSKAQQDTKKQQSEGDKRVSEHAATAQPKKKFTGRPDDAVIMGDLPKDAKAKQVAMDDSIMRHMRDSIQAAKKEEAPDTSWMKKEYVPVTSIIHTLAFNTNDREYISNATSENFYLKRYNVSLEDAPGDSICDVVKYYTLRNTVALGMLEGFNKWVPFGLKAFITHDLTHYTMPDTVASRSAYNEHSVFVGAEIIRTTGHVLHFKAVGDIGVIGKQLGDVRIDGVGDVNMRLFRDTAQVKLKAFYHLTTPNFLQRHYTGKFFFWNHDDFSKQSQLHLEGEFFLRRTKTRLRACYDNIQNYVYLGVNYNKQTVDETTTVTGYTADMMQTSSNISLFTLQLEQDFRFGILNWENRITYQTSTQQSILAVPTINVWTNLYLNFKIARVLKVHFGVDMRYYTEYEAPEYCPQVGQYAVYQGERTKTGNCPVLDVYANLQLKKCRFFIMMSGLYTGKNRFFTPHYPLNESTLRFGLSWDFHN